VCSANASGMTALHSATAEGNLPCLQALIGAGVLIDAVNSEQRTAHDLAKIYAHKHCARSVVCSSTSSDTKAFHIEPQRRREGLWR